MMRRSWRGVVRRREDAPAELGGELREDLVVAHALSLQPGVPTADVGLGRLGEVGNDVADHARRLTDRQAGGLGDTGDEVGVVHPPSMQDEPEGGFQSAHVRTDIPIGSPRAAGPEAGR